MDRTICGVCGSWLGDDELIALRKELETIHLKINAIVKERDDALDSIPVLLKAASDMEEQRDAKTLAFNIAFEQGKQLAQELDDVKIENERMRELLNAIPDSILRPSYYGSTQWGTDICIWKAISAGKERQ